MKRLFLSLVAAVAVAGALPVGSATAGDRGGHGGGRGGGGWADGGGSGWDRGGRGGGRWADAPRAAPVRDEAPRGDRGGGNRGRGPENRAPEARNPEPRRYERPSVDYPAAAEAPRAYGVRRGGYLPPQGGAAIQDHSRYGLRAPPRGYTWMATPRGYALVNQATGQIFDVVPGR